MKIHTLTTPSFITLTTISFLMTFFILGCSSEKERNIKIKAQKPILVKIAKVQKKIVNNKISLVGQLEGEIEIDVFPDTNVSGIIKNVKVIEGSKVKKGSPLMEIDQQAVTGRSYRRFFAKAKISGFVSRVYVKEGALVNPQTKLCRIIQMDKIKILIDIPEKDITKIKKGLNVEIYLTSYPDNTITGTINRIYPALDPATLTLRTEVILDNKDYKLKSGMFATVDILLDKKEKILVPINSVLMEDNIAYVFLYDDKNTNAKKTIIIAGQPYGKNIEVINGLKPKQNIIVEGNYQINDGEPVNVANKEDI